MIRTHYSREIKPSMDGKKVTVAGWVQHLRILGSISFIKLRDNDGIIQIAVPKSTGKLFKSIRNLSLESAIVVKGTVKKSKEAQAGFEIIPEKIDILSKAEVPLPLDVSGKINSNLNTRLNWRSLDLRIPRNKAIFEVQSKIVEGMENYLRKEKFTQVFTPCLIGAVSEGGADVFSINYFKKHAFLRQDPQLHRQLLIAAGLEKVFDLGPSWRAEVSRTTRHLCEHRGCAVEIAFIEDEADTMRLEEDLVIATLKHVKKECAEELKLFDVNVEIPKTPFLELRFPKIYDILEELGKKPRHGEDISDEEEALLGDYVKKKYKSDFFFMNRFPFAVKPFYVMKVDEEPEYARSVDLVYKGLEQSSGGQREHRYGKIIQQVKEKKIDPKNLKWFTEVFKFGVPPHGGFNLGIERFTKQLLNLENIREATLFPRDPDRALP